MVDSSTQTDGIRRASTSVERNDKPPADAPRDLPTRLVEHVEVVVEAVLGSSSIKIADLSHLSIGQVFELDRQINEAVDIRVNGKVIARGEIVTVDESFAVRIAHLG